MGEAPGHQGEQVGFSIRCGRVRLFWYLGLLLKQREAAQVLLADHSILKAISTENGLKLFYGRVRKAGEGMEDNLVRGYASQDGHQDVQVLGELVLRLVHCLLVWRSGLGVLGNGVIPLHLKES